MSDPEEVAALLEQLWQANRGVLLDRLDVVVAGLSGAPGTDLQDAARQAHSLAGALGTYGRPGSPLLKSAERALADGAADDGARATLAQEVRALRSVLEG